MERRSPRSFLKCNFRILVCCMHSFHSAIIKELQEKTSNLLHLWGRASHLILEESAWNLLPTWSWCGVTWVVPPPSFHQPWLSRNSSFRRFRGLTLTPTELIFLRISINLVVATPLTENMPGPSATKPGDMWVYLHAKFAMAHACFSVYAMNGKSVEIDNTDAEGRLVLSGMSFFSIVYSIPNSWLTDAIYYVSTEYKPHTLIDVATLTGYETLPCSARLNAEFPYSAMVIAVGEVYSGVFSVSMLSLVFPVIFSLVSSDIGWTLGETSSRWGSWIWSLLAHAPWWRLWPPNPLFECWFAECESNVSDILFQDSGFDVRREDGRQEVAQLPFSWSRLRTVLRLRTEKSPLWNGHILILRVLWRFVILIRTV